MKSPQRALVVEDEPSWQQILGENLADAGLQVDSAGSLEAARRLLHQHSYRVALVDLSLQGDDPHNQDGLAVLDAVRQTNPGCAAVLITGFATVELAVQVLTEGKAISCLRKEAFQRSQLRDLIRQALATPPVEEPRSHGTPGKLAAAWAQPAASPRGRRALVVDDDAGWRSILQEQLGEAGFTTRLCASFGEALGVLRHEPFQLALVDLSLSGAERGWQQTPQELEGYRLLRAAQEVGIPAVVVSGISSADEIERAYQQGGIYAYVEKQSFNRRAFLRLVDEALQASQAASDLSALTGREHEVLHLVGQGRTNREIAEQLMISENTVKRHVKAIFRKLDIHTRAAAAARLAGAPAEKTSRD